MYKPLSLRKNFAWIFSSGIFYSFCQWAIFSIYTKQLAPEYVGGFAYAGAICSPVILLLSMRSNQILAADSVSQFDFGVYLSLRLISGIAALLICFIIGFFSIGKPWEFEKLWLILILVAFTKFFETVSEILWGLFQRKEVMIFSAISRYIRGSVLIIIAVGIVYFSKSLMLALFSILICWFLILYFFEINIAKKLTFFKFSWNRDNLLKLSIKAAPLGVSGFLISLNTNVGRYFLKSYEGLDKVAFFAAITYIVTASGLFFIALGQVVIPRLSNYRHQNKRAFLNLLLKAVFISFGFILAVQAVGQPFAKEILNLLYRPEYASYYSQFRIVLVGAGAMMMASLFSSIAVSLQLFGQQLVITSLAVLNNFIMCCFWVPKFGLTGASWAYTASSLILLAGYVVILVLKIKNNYRYE